jgi:hypothetical protein
MSASTVFLIWWWMKKSVRSYPVLRYRFLNFSDRPFLCFFKVKISHNKTGSLLDGPCSFLDSNLESGEECYVYRTLIVGILVSGAPTLRWMFGNRSANGCSNRTVLDATANFLWDCPIRFFPLLYLLCFLSLRADTKDLLCVALFLRTWKS